MEERPGRAEEEEDAERRAEEPLPARLARREPADPESTGEDDPPDGVKPLRGRFDAGLGSYRATASVAAFASRLNFLKASGAGPYDSLSLWKRRIMSSRLRCVISRAFSR